MPTLIHNGIVVIDGTKLIQHGGVVWDQGKIIEVLTQDDSKLQQYLKENKLEIIDAQRQYIIPGLIDIHLHGAVGRDFEEASQEAINEISANLVQDGCTSFMASLTPMSPEKSKEVLQCYAAIKAYSQGAHFLGIHYEGPYLSHAYKAVMIEENLRLPSLAEYDELLELSNHRLAIMTVAPELAGMMEFIAHASKHTTIMIGHSAADSKTATAALQQGAAGFTHLYNAMSQHLHRQPGVVTSAFINQHAYVELIADGLHVDPEVILMTYVTKKARSIILVSDAMLGKGMPDGEFFFSGKRCIKQGNSATVIETGRRSGSVVGLDVIARTFQAITGCTINEIVQMAAVNPSILAKVSNLKGTLEVGKDADICIMNHALEAQMTFVSGVCVYQRPSERNNI